MEVSRNEGLKGSQGFKGARAAATLQDVRDSVCVEAGSLPDLGERDAMGVAPRVDAVDGGVAGGDHGGDEITKLWDVQQQSQNAVLGPLPLPLYAGCMPYDPNRSRAAVLAVIASKKLTPTGWCLKSGLSKNALREFLAKRSESLKVSTAVALAESEGISPLVLMGITPSTDMVLPEEVMRQATEAMQSATTKSAEASAQAENSARLILALAQALGIAPAPPPPALLPPGRPRPRRS